MRVLYLEWWKKPWADNIFSKQVEILLFCKWDGVNVAYDTFCVNLRPNDGSQLRTELLCNHQEADTRMLLHDKLISDTNIRNIVINRPDTDVYLIGIAALNQINFNLFICTGTKNKPRIILIS